MAYSVRLTSMVPTAGVRLPRDAARLEFAGGISGGKCGAVDRSLRCMRTCRATVETSHSLRVRAAQGCGSSCDIFAPELRMPRGDPASSTAAVTHTTARRTGGELTSAAARSCRQQSVLAAERPQCWLGRESRQDKVWPRGPRQGQSRFLRRNLRRLTRGFRHVTMCAGDEGAGHTNENDAFRVGSNKSDRALRQPLSRDAPPNRAASSAAGAAPVKDATASSRSGGGTILGAVALIIGTSVGAGVLALPAETAPAGVFPSSFVLIACWAFLCLEALLLAEVNVALIKERSVSSSTVSSSMATSSTASSSSNSGTISSTGAAGSEQEPERGSDVLSYRTMAEATLGPVGGTVATVAYVFLSFTLIVAYFAKGGEVLAFGTGLPNWVGAVGFFSVLGGLIYSGSTRTADIINRVLTAGLLGIFTLLVCGGAAIADWDELAVADWSEMPTTLPVIFLALVFHDLIPVICTYLDANLGKIRAAIVIGSAAPLTMFLVWDAIALSISPSSLTSAAAAAAAAPAGAFSLSSLSSAVSSLSSSLSHLASSLPSSLSTALSTPSLAPSLTPSLPHSLSTPFQDPLNLLLLQGSPLQSSVVLAFSFLAVATSFLGTSLALAEFFMEQLGLISAGDKKRDEEQLGLISVGDKRRNEEQHGRIDLKSQRNQAQKQQETAVTAVDIAGTGLGFVRSHGREVGFLLALCPPLLVALANPGAFVAASKAAGAYGMTVLYGIMPPLMFYAHHKQEAIVCDPATKDCSTHHRWLEPGGSFALASMGACAFSVIAGQALLDSSLDTSFLSSRGEGASFVLAQSDSVLDNSAQQCGSVVGANSGGDIIVSSTTSSSSSNNNNHINDSGNSPSSSSSSVDPASCSGPAAVANSPAAVAANARAVNPPLVFASQSAPDTSDLHMPLPDSPSVVEI